jgi:putative FmdB family regulatory protein
MRHTIIAMPLYEFTCQACGQRFEKLFRSMSARPQAPCPKCGSKQTVRALSLVNAGESKQAAGPGDAPMCGRCGGPGPCAMDD